MATTSTLLKLTLQALNDNIDSWGDVLNDSAIRLLEDAISKTSAISLVSQADYTLDDAAGGPTAADGARSMILDIGGSPGGTTNIIVPQGAGRTKVYLAVNSTSDASAVVIKTSSGTGVTIDNGKAYWVYCDGTDVLPTHVSNALTADQATLSTDSNQLGSVAAAGYAKLATAQTFTAGQTVQRATPLTQTASQITPNLNQSNCFYALWADNYTLAAPTGAIQNGTTFTLVIQQPAVGGKLITYNAAYVFENGVKPTLSTGNNAVDYFGFEYCTDIGGKWIGAALKGLA